MALRAVGVAVLASALASLPAGFAVAVGVLCVLASLEPP
jgi:hypothetical protein